MSNNPKDFIDNVHTAAVSSLTISHQLTTRITEQHQEIIELRSEQRSDREKIAELTTKVALLEASNNAADAKASKRLMWALAIFSAVVTLLCAVLQLIPLLKK